MVKLQGYMAGRGGRPAMGLAGPSCLGFYRLNSKARKIAMIGKKKTEIK
jgi:hypothetical protein